jgi:amino acid transporter
MLAVDSERGQSAALAQLSARRPRNVSWREAAGLLFGDWGTSRLYVLGLAFAFAGGTSVYLIAAMSLLILAVGWAYTQICRIYPDGGGVYTAAKHTSRTLAVVGALLLFADYVVTASLSSLDAFHYFGLNHVEALFAMNSPGMWAIVAIGVIGAFNLLGPKHTGGFAIAAACAMVGITLVIAFGAVPQLRWESIVNGVGPVTEGPSRLWLHFVGIVLALSGVEAIGNLTGVMRQPVPVTARKSIWIVATEVALFNVLLGLCMVSQLGAGGERQTHKEDMLAFLAGASIGVWAEWGVRVVGGLLLLSAVNTVITDMISVQYLLSRDGELPGAFQRLNRFGVPWLATVLATGVPILVLVFNHDLEHLAALYAIGVVGAVSINITLVSLHPRLRRTWRKAAALALGAFLLAIWVTLAATKLHALVFVCLVMVVGLSARALTKWVSRRRPDRLSLLRQAVQEQLSAGVLAGPKVLLGTYGSDQLAPAALGFATAHDTALVVCFIRQVGLSYKHGAEARLTFDTDPVAQRTFARFLELGHAAGVPIIPVYDAGHDAAELLAEHAAMMGCARVLIGTSRRGTLHHLIKGHFQRQLESLLPPDLPVEVLSPPAGPEPPVA